MGSEGRGVTKTRTTADLKRLLAHVQRRYFPRVLNIHISWGTPEQLTDGIDWPWAVSSWAHPDGRFIVLSDRLKRAPRYVVMYAVFHEVLHFHVASRKVTRRDGTTYWVHHPRAFVLAEHAFEYFKSAARWMRSNENLSAGDEAAA